jgi:hypothetical protein
MAVMCKTQQLLDLQLQVHFLRACLWPAVGEMQDAPPPEVYCKPGRGVWVITKAVMRDHWLYALGVVMSYLVSFMLFPAVLGYVEVSDALLKSSEALWYVSLLTGRMR